ncbi:MAG: hypothetical protein LBU60_05100 [Clostridiales bacterium]|jgi:cation transport ATPase|nr:hypothetical protein [Clostridiales bacterium]
MNDQQNTYLDDNFDSDSVQLKSTFKNTRKIEKILSACCVHYFWISFVFLMVANSFDFLNFWIAFVVVCIFLMLWSLCGITYFIKFIRSTKKRSIVILFLTFLPVILFLAFLVFIAFFANQDSVPQDASGSIMTLYAFAMIWYEVVKCIICHRTKSDEYFM